MSRAENGYPMYHTHDPESDLGMRKVVRRSRIIKSYNSQGRPMEILDVDRVSRQMAALESIFTGVKES